MKKYLIFFVIVASIFLNIINATKFLEIPIKLETKVVDGVPRKSMMVSESRPHAWYAPIKYETDFEVFEGPLMLGTPL